MLTAVLGTLIGLAATMPSFGPREPLQHVTPARLVCSQSRSCPDDTDVLGVLEVTVAYYAQGKKQKPKELFRSLKAICQRESRCQVIQGVHETDAHLDGYWGQVRLGHLNPTCQAAGKGWATRGPWGLSAASHYSYLPPCYQPDVLDSSWVSADVAVRKYLARCVGKKTVGPHTRGWCGKKTREK